MNKVIFGSIFCLMGLVGVSEANASSLNDSGSVLEVSGGAEASGNGTSCKLSRINVLTGAFVELDLWVAELKVLPYVELRFNRRK